MKKLIGIILVFVVLLTCCACSSTKLKDNNSEETEALQIEYYSNTNVPTLDSVLDENQIDGNDSNHLYGPYSTKEEGLAVMSLYVAALVETHGFERLQSSVGFKLTNGADNVEIFGGNYGDQFAIMVLVNQ